MKTSVIFALSLLFCGIANAQLSVNRSVVEFSGTDKIQDIEVTNTGNFKIYVDMKVAEILNPELENPTRVELNDPRTAAVLVSPKQLLLQPGARKRVRIIMRQKADDKDRVFRLAVKPYTGKLKVDASSDDKTRSAIKVLIGYDLLLLSRPSSLKPDLKVTRSADSIEFRNSGNTNVLLRDIKQCNKSKTDCIDLQPNRLYAGEVYRVDLPKKGDANQFPVEVMQSVGLSNELELY